MQTFDPLIIPKARVKARRQKWGVPENAVLVLLPGRLTRWKGQLVAIEAMMHLDESYHLVLLGDAQGREQYVSELNNFAVQCGVWREMYLPGHDADVAAAYLAADIVICPSIDPEAFGRTAAEAQALGRPVIAADHGGAVEVVEHGVTGWRTPPGDAKALANAILAVDDLTGVSGARDRIAANYSKTALQKALLGVYADLMKPILK